MAFPSFYTELIGLGREEIAELLLVLLLVILFMPRVAGLRGVRFILILLTFGLVTAHYSLAFIYLAMLAVSFIIGNAWKKALPLDVAVSVLFAAVIVGLWYVVIVSPAALFSLTKFSSLVAEGFTGSFLNFGARPAEVLGIGAAGGLSHIANRYLQYFVMGILVLGFFTVLTRKNNVEEEKMLPLMMVGMFLAGAIVALPFFAEALNVTRTFHIALIFIAPCLVYGISTLSKMYPRFRSLFHHKSTGDYSKAGRNRWIWPAGLLLLYFLFSSGLVFAVAMDTPTSPIVDLQRMMNSSNQNVVLYFNSYYRNPQDVAGARWLSNWRGNSFVCADFIAGNEVLLSYGEISASQQYQISTLPPSTSCFIFSSVMNSRYGIWSSSGSGSLTFPISSLSNITTVNRVYSNGGSVTYYNRVSSS
ncbi:MAG TPA: DUF2206 domain-containing protein [Candidatus Bathyarchaeia archaeon]|nr:DUF2206 domain-containing protein [Candidatus Bathyarchaeia archaeon]